MEELTLKRGAGVILEAPKRPRYWVVDGLGEVDDIVGGTIVVDVELTAFVSFIIIEAI